MRMRLHLFSLSAALAAATSGCLMAGNYHSARTLEKGESAFGMTWGLTQYTFKDSEGQDRNFVLPILIPELTYHIGFSDDVELGGRMAPGSLALEADLKWRFYHDDKLHLAVAPSLGYQALGSIQGLLTRLPGILTYDLADNFAVNLALFGSVNSYSSTDTGGDFEAFHGELAGTGGSFGLELRGETFAIRPAIEVTRFVASSQDNFEAFNIVNVLVHLSWIGGREKKQLNRMERKLDRVLEQQGGTAQPPVTNDSDYRTPPSAPAPTSTPSP